MKHDNNQLLRIGDELFRKQGYHNTGTEEILEKGNYPRSSFYHHFKSKEGFGVKTLELYGERIKKLLEKTLNDPKEKSPVKRLKNYFFMIAKYAGDSCYESVCLVQRFSIDTVDQDDKLKSEAYNQLQSWVRITSQCIKEGQEKGEFRDDIGTNELSEFLFSMIYGGHTIGKISKNPKDLRTKMDLAFKLIMK